MTYRVIATHNVPSLDDEDDDMMLSGMPGNLSGLPVGKCVTLRLSYHPGRDKQFATTDTRVAVIHSPLNPSVEQCGYFQLLLLRCTLIGSTTLLLCKHALEAHACFAALRLGPHCFTRTTPTRRIHSCKMLSQISVAHSNSSSGSHLSMQRLGPTTLDTQANLGMWLGGNWTLGGGDFLRIRPKCV
jgi:hypothetical protein